MQVTIRVCKSQSGRLRMTLDCSIEAKEIAMESGFFVGGRRETLLCSCK